MNQQTKVSLTLLLSCLSFSLSIDTCFAFPELPKGLISSDRILTLSLSDHGLSFTGVAKFDTSQLFSKFDQVSSGFVRSDLGYVFNYDKGKVFLFSLSVGGIHLVSTIEDVVSFRVDGEKFFYYLSSKSGKLYMFDPSTSTTQEFSDFVLFDQQDIAFIYLGNSRFLFQVGNSLAVYNVSTKAFEKSLPNFRYHKLLSGSTSPEGFLTFHYDNFIDSRERGNLKVGEPYNFTNPNNTLIRMADATDSAKYIGNGVYILEAYIGNRSFPSNMPEYEPFILFRKQIYSLSWDLKNKMKNSSIYIK